jgi:hypothetical protein
MDALQHSGQRGEDQVAARYAYFFNTGSSRWALKNS